MIDYLQPQQANILIALSKFKYMTKKQFIYYGIGKENPSLYNNFAILREKKLISRYRFSERETVLGRLEDIHFLTEKGAKIVAENLDISLDLIKYPNRTSTEFKNDYFHRINTVYVLISFTMWAEKQGYEIDLIDTYFDKIGSQKKSDTGVQSRTRLDLPNGTDVKADAIIKYHKGNESYLFCIEMYNGKDTKRINEQLRKLTYATFEGVPSIKYNHSKGNRNLIILDQENYIKYAIDRLKNDPYLAQFDGLERFFYFSNLDNIKNNFGLLWVDLEGKNRNLDNL